MASESATISSNALEDRFAQLRAVGRKALVCYATAGFPDRATSVAVLRALEEGGADAVEVGVPFSDPVADGAVIQDSSQVALAGGTTLVDVLEIVREAHLSVPIILFSYLNPLLAAGAGVLARAREAGCDGVLVTDLPVGADPERERWLGESGLAFIRLVAPTTPASRIAEISRHGGGFVYLISRLGVTGMQQSLAADLPETVARVRQAARLPVCVGFGVSTPDQAREVASLADGVVVGSAVVRAAERGPDAVLSLTRALRDAVDAA